MFEGGYNLTGFRVRVRRLPIWTARYFHRLAGWPLAFVSVGIL